MNNPKYIIYRKLRLDNLENNEYYWSTDRRWRWDKTKAMILSEKPDIQKLSKKQSSKYFYGIQEVYL